MGLQLRGYAALPRIAAVRKAYNRYMRSDHPPQSLQQRTEALVIIGTGIGNIIEQTPLVVAVTEMYQHVDVFLPLSSVEVADVIRGMPGIRRLYVYKSGYAELGMRKQAYAAIFATYLVCDFPKRIKHDVRYLSGAFTAASPGEAITCMVAAKRAGYMADMPAIWCRQDTWDYPLPDAPLVGITAGSSIANQWRLKRYKRYAEVVDCILKQRPRTSFVNIGTLDDDEIKHVAVLDLRGLTTIGQAATVASKCDAYMANDCGMAHVAAAVGTPTTVVFGPTYVAKNMPVINAKPLMLSDLHCRPCQYSRRGLGRLPKTGVVCKRACLRTLDPVTVSEAVIQYL